MYRVQLLAEFAEDAAAVAAAALVVRRLCARGRGFSSFLAD